MLNRLEYIKLNNPLLTELDDEKILNLYHRQYYSDMDYNTFKQKATAPLEDYNKFILQSIKPREELRKVEGYDDGYAELIKQYPQEKVKNWQSKGAMNTWESWKNLKLLNCIPVAGATAEGFKNQKLLNLKEKIKYGTATDEEVEYFNTSMEKLAELQVRGSNIGGKIVNGVCGSVAFMGEMALTSTGYGAFLSLPPEIYKSYQTRKLNDNIAITDKGEVFFTEYNKLPAMTLLKSLGDVGVSYSVEMFGGKLLDKGFNKLLSTTLFKNMGANKIAKIMNKPLDWVNRNSTKLLGKAGFNGVLEEYGEERLEDLVRTALNLDDKGRNLEAFKDAIFPSIEDNLAELGVITILGAGGATISTTSQKLYDKLKSKNINPNNIISVIANTPELEKEKMLNKLNKIDEEQDNQAFNQRLNDFKQKLTKASVDEKEAENLTTLHSNIITNYANDLGISKTEIFDTIELEIEKENLKNTLTTPEQMVDYINNFLTDEYKEYLKNNNKSQITKEELLDDLKYYRQLQKEINKTKSGTSLVQFLSKHGGIYDEGGDIGQIKDIRNQAPFLLRKELNNNNTLDDQFKSAVEAGYFPEIEDYRDVDGVNTLIEAIQDELSGNKRYPYGENKKLEKQEEISQLEEDLYSRGIDIKDIEYLEQMEKGNVYNQSSYKSPETDIKDFVKKINTWLDNNQKIEKQSYFIIDKANDIRIDTDTIRHTRDHKLTPEEWEDIGSSLDIKNVINYKFSKRYNRYGNKSIILEIKGNLNTYGVVLTNSNFNYIETAFRKDNTNLWNEWWKKSKYDVYNSEDNKERASGSFHTLSDNSKVITSIADIIIQAKNLFVNKNNNTYLQIAYHGSPYSFDKFTLDHIGEGEGAQAHGWGLYFALDRRTAEGYKNNDNISVLSFIPKTAREIIRNIEEYPDYTYYYDIFTDNNPYSKIKEKQKNNKQYLKDGYITEEEYKQSNKILAEFLKKKVYNETSNEESKLYEVDIPNDSSMLFEDKSIKEQSKNIKETIKILIKDSSISDKLYEELKYKIKDYTYLASDLYKDLSNDLGGDKQASELLNIYGIQGIRYNGRTDGECAVVFDDKAISIIKKYNQSINTDLELNQEIEILDIKDLLKNNNKISKADAKKLIWEIAGKGEQIDTLSDPWIIDIINDRAKKLHLLNSSRMGKFDNASYFRRNIELNNIRDIINNSILVERVNNTKQNKKPDVNEYFYFYTPITDGKNIYIIKLIGEKLIGENSLNNIHLYDILDNQINVRANSNKSNNKASAHQSDTLTIKQILQNVKDFNGNNALTSYFLENNNLSQDTQNNSYLKKGQISLTDTKAIITLFQETNDASTIIHEMGHYYMKLMEIMAKKNPKAKEYLNKANNFIDKEIKRSNYQTQEDYEIARQEYFARSFEAYLRRGIAPSKELRNIFERFREWLVEVYNSVKELNVKLTPEVIDFFDNFIVNNKLLDNIDSSFEEYQKLQEEIYNEREALVLNQSINTDLELNKEVEILDISNTIKGKITKETIKQKIQELIDKKEPIKTLSEPYMMELLNKKKNHIIHSSKEFKNFTELKQHNNQLLNIDNLIKNSILIETVDNIKKDKKPYVDKYLYFYTPVKDGKNIYIVKLFTEQGKNNKENVVNLYDVLAVKELSTKHSENKTPVMSTQGGRVIDNSSAVTIKQILQNVKDFNGNNALESYYKEEIDQTIDNKYSERLNKIYDEINNGEKQTLDDTFYNNLINYSKKNKNNNKFSRYFKSFGKYVKDCIRDSIANADEVIASIDPSLANKLKRFQTDIILTTDENKKKALPFFKTLEYIRKTNENDYLILDMALKNRDINKIQELTNKYNFYNEYINIRELLNNLREQAISVGIDVGYLNNYFPRQVDPKRKNEFISFLRANETGTYNDLLYNLEQLRNNKLFTQEDELKFINNFLRGFIPKDLILLTSNGNLKNPRSIEIITPEMAEYFLPSNIALQNYIEATTKDVITREAFGIEDKETRDLRNKLKEKHRQLKRVEETPAGKFKTNQEYKLAVNKAVKEKNLERLSHKANLTIEEQEQLKNIHDEIESIETQIDNLQKTNAFAVKNNHIKQIKQEIEEIKDKLPSDKLEDSIANFVNSIENLDLEQNNILKKYISSIVNPAPSTTLTKIINNTAYGLALTSFKNALNQLPELAVSFYKNGFFNTVESIITRHKINMEDLGLEDVVGEINKRGLDFINKVLTLTGFNKIDMFGKNTFLNSNLIKTKKELINNNEDTNRDIEQLMTKDAEKVKEDILNDRMSFEVKEYLLMKLAGVQPILVSSRPYNYLNGGNARIFYTLKIFSIKQLNMLHNDILKKITSLNKKETIEGLKNLVKYQAFLFMVGAPIDIIMGLATGYDDEDENLITDAMIDNLIIFNIMSRYTLSKAGKQGIGSAAVDYLFTPVSFRFANDIQKDIVKLFTGELEFENWRTLKYLPFGKDLRTLKEVVDE